jgi:hypothetical protein
MAGLNNKPGHDEFCWLAADASLLPARGAR